MMRGHHHAPAACPQGKRLPEARSSLPVLAGCPTRLRLAPRSRLWQVLMYSRSLRFAGLACGCPVRTTAELLLALLPAWQFSREPDLCTGYAELQVRPR